LRSNNKIYDPKWLVAQLKISRAVVLEDLIKNSETKKSLRKESAAVSTEKSKTVNEAASAKKIKREDEDESERAKESAAVSTEKSKTVNEAASAKKK